MKSQPTKPGAAMPGTRVMVSSCSKSNSSRHLVQLVIAPRIPPTYLQEYAAFMKHVEVDSTAAASQQAAEEQESATDRQARDEFEQL